MAHFLHAQLRQYTFLVLVFFAFAVAFVPVSAFATDPLSDTIVPSCDAVDAYSGVDGAIFGGACQLCDLIELADNLMRFAVAFSVVAATLMFLYAGILYFTAASKPDNIKKAHGIFIKVLAGLVLVLAAWLIVDILMKTLMGGNLAEGKWGPWNEIECIAYPVGPHLNARPARAPISSVSRGLTGRTCAPQTGSSNPCSVETLRTGCFSARAEDASRICMVESGGGNATAESGSDRLADGRTYSVGLWQINLTVNDINGMGCPNAFTAPCSGENIRNQGAVGRCSARVKPDQASQQLYTRCVAAAKIPANSTAAACRLYANGGFSHWRHTAQNVCQPPIAF